MKKFKNRYRIQSHRKPDWAYSNNAYYFLTIVTQKRECHLGKIVNAEMILSDFGKIVESEWYSSFEIRKELTLHAFVLMPNHLHAIVEIHQIENHERLHRPAAMSNNPGCHGTIGVESNGTVNHVSNGTIGDELDGTIDHVSNGTVNHVLNAEAHGRVPLRAKPLINHSKPNAIQKNQLPVNESTPNDSTKNGLPSMKRNPPVRLPNSISSFIACFKSTVNTKIDDLIDEQNLPIKKFNRTNHFFQPNYHDHIVKNEIEYHFIKNYIDNNPAKWEEDQLKKWINCDAP